MTGGSEVKAVTSGMVEVMRNWWWMGTRGRSRPTILPSSRAQNPTREQLGCSASIIQKHNHGTNM